MNSLPKTVTRQRRDCDLDPGPSAPESSTLTTRLPSDPLKCTAQISTTADPAKFRKLLKILLCSRCKHWLTVLRYFGIRWLTKKKTDTRTINVVNNLKVLHRRLCDTTVEVELVGLSVYGTTHTPHHRNNTARSVSGKNWEHFTNKTTHALTNYYYIYLLRECCSRCGFHPFFTFIHQTGRHIKT